jgi:putative hydrolase of the HAD superfamily
MLSNSFIGAREREEARYRLGEMTELIVYSHEEGIEKPDAQIYERTCELLALPPGETVFLDDVEAYVEGARAIGMHAILYRDNAQAIRDIEALLG